MDCVILKSSTFHPYILPTSFKYMEKQSCDSLCTTLQMLYYTMLHIVLVYTYSMNLKIHIHRYMFLSMYLFINSQFPLYSTKSQSMSKPFCLIYRLNGIAYGGQEVQNNITKCETLLQRQKFASWKTFLHDTTKWLLPRTKHIYI